MHCMKNRYIFQSSLGSSCCRGITADPYILLSLCISTVCRLSELNPNQDNVLRQVLKIREVKDSGICDEGQSYVDPIANLKELCFSLT